MEIEEYLGYKIPVKTVDHNLMVNPAPPAEVKRNERLIGKRKIKKRNRKQFSRRGENR